MKCKAFLLDHLQKAKDVFQRNVRHKAGIPQICVFVTDGTSKNTTKTIEAAQEVTVLYSDVRKEI